MKKIQYPLSATHPALAEEWHPENDVTYGSSKKVWWKCEKGHEWEASVNNRNRKDKGGCPVCRKKKRT